MFCGCVLSFGSCAAQIKVAPYSEPTSNLLKALVEAQIFVTFLISFILRVLSKIASSEPVEADACVRLGAGVDAEWAAGDGCEADGAPELAAASRAVGIQRVSTRWRRAR